MFSQREKVRGKYILYNGYYRIKKNFGNIQFTITATFGNLSLMSRVAKYHYLFELRQFFFLIHLLCNFNTLLPYACCKFLFRVNFKGSIWSLFAFIYLFIFLPKGIYYLRKNKKKIYFKI